MNIALEADTSGLVEGAERADAAIRRHTIRLRRPPRVPYVKPLKRIHRNGPCPCGSGRKAKKCCLSNERAPS